MPLTAQWTKSILTERIFDMILPPSARAVVRCSRLRDRTLFSEGYANNSILLSQLYRAF